MNIISRPICLLVLLTLAACGGGGGGDTGPGASTSDPGTSQSTPQGPVDTPGTLVTTVTPDTYAADSIAHENYTYLNDVLRAGGFGTLAQNAALDKAIAKHLQYMYANVAQIGLFTDVDPQTGYLKGHVEHLTDSPYYGGLYPADRAKAAGYGGSAVSEVLSPTGVMEPLRDRHIGASR